MNLEVICQLDDIIYDHKDTFLYIFISRLFWISVEIFLDLLMEIEKKIQKQLRQHQTGKFTDLGKTPR